jgi:hypothetical protein
MSTDTALEKPESLDTAPGLAWEEHQIGAWLLAHPDFLLRHTEVFTGLELAHKSGTAVSLIERQVDILRSQKLQLNERLERFTEHARENEIRAANTYKLARALIRAPSLAAIMAALKRVMREDFQLEEVFVGLNPQLFQRRDIPHMAAIKVRSPLALDLDNFQRTKLLECGPISEARARLIWPEAMPLPCSAALVPLERERDLGFVALGSCNPERFQPRQGKLFLETTAELLAAGIRSRLQ